MDDDSTCAQLFVGTKDLVTDFYGMKTKDNVRKRGAIDNLMSDST